jgi:hypothetical protein
MQRIAVKSSQVAEIGFENGVLEVQFQARGDRSNGAFLPGPVYRYHGPNTQQHYDGLLAEHNKEEGSVGSYFIKTVKPAYSNDPNAESRYERATDL